MTSDGTTEPTSLPDGHLFAHGSGLWSAACVAGGGHTSPASAGRARPPPPVPFKVLPSRCLPPSSAASATLALLPPLPRPQSALAPSAVAEPTFLTRRSFPSEARVSPAFSHSACTEHTPRPNRALRVSPCTSFRPSSSRSLSPPRPLPPPPRTGGSAQYTSQSSSPSSFTSVPTPL